MMLRTDRLARTLRSFDCLIGLAKGATDMTEQKQLPPVPDAGEVDLPNGCTLFWKLDPSVNCRHYVSDEIGGGVDVWHTALVDYSTILAALVCEERLRRLELEHEKRALREGVDADVIVGSIAGGMSIEAVQREYRVTTEQISAAIREALHAAATLVLQQKDTGPQQ